MRSKSDWLDAGLVELAADGPRGLRLEVLCRAMGSTRGSFYHHFTDIDGYRRALVEHFEQLRTDRYIAEADAAAGGGPMAALSGLRDAVFAEMSEQGMLLERAMRAWGTQEAHVAEVTSRVDQRRLAYLTELLGLAGVDDAGDYAQIVYLVMVGGLHLSPPVPAERMRELADRALAAALDVADRPS